MSSWDFAEAQKRIPAAAAVLATRDELATLLADSGVDAPTALRAAYESATTGMDEAQATADAEVVAARALVAAGAAVARPRDAIVSFGLVGTTPDADLAAAKAAFQQGAPDAAARADAVTALIGGAAAIGQGRVALGVGGLIVVALVLLAAILVVLQRRANARARLAAGPPSYATLADQSSATAQPPADRVTESPAEPAADASPERPPDPPEERDTAP